MATTTKNTTTDTTTNTDPATPLARLRAEIAAVHAEMAAVARAPLPIEEAVASLRASFHGLADRYWRRADQVLADFARGAGDVRSAVPQWNDPPTLDAAA